MSHACFIGKYNNSVEILACCWLAVNVAKYTFFKITVTSVQRRLLSPQIRMCASMLVHMHACASVCL